MSHSKRVVQDALRFIRQEPEGMRVEGDLEYWENEMKRIKAEEKEQKDATDNSTA